MAEAKARRHSTLSEAMEVGASMDADCLLLTHFSQRYCQAPTTGKRRGKGKMIAAMAFDGMRVPVSQLNYLKHQQKAMRVLFQQQQDNSSDSEGTG
jgi:ribonuclease Z